MENLYKERQEEYSQNKQEQAIDRTKAQLPKAAIELEQYRETMQTAFATKTMENYLTHLSKFLVGSHTRTGKLRIKGVLKPLSKITNKDVVEYWKRLREMSEGTKYATWQALRSYFCSYLKWDRQMNKSLESKWELLMRNIQRPVTSKKNISKEDLVTPEMIKQLLGACKNWRDKAFFTVLFETGARLGELLGMRIGDINFNASPVEVKITVSKTERTEGKRTVYLQESVPLLKRWLEEHPLNDGRPSFYQSNEPIWVTVIGKKPRVLNSATSRRIIENVRERAGIPSNKMLFAHLFRRSAAFQWKKYGLDVKDIKELLGHTKIDTTDGYLTIDRDEIISKLTQRNEQGGDWWKNKALLDEKEQELTELMRKIQPFIDAAAQRAVSEIGDQHGGVAK